jgi:hypothetical protein
MGIDHTIPMKQIQVVNQICEENGHDWELHYRNTTEGRS